MFWSQTITLWSFIPKPSVFFIINSKFRPHKLIFDHRGQYYSSEPKLFRDIFFKFFGINFWRWERHSEEIFRIKTILVRAVHLLAPWGDSFFVLNFNKVIKTSTFLTIDYGPLSSSWKLFRSYNRVLYCERGFIRSSDGFMVSHYHIVEL